MKISILYLILLTVLISCNQEKQMLEYSQQKADEFVEIHADKFLQDTQLLIYSYHPRTKFTFEQSTSNNYRILPNDNEVALICYSESCKLTEPFNTSPLKVSKGNYVLKQDTLIKEFGYDSTTFQIQHFKQSPEKYFNGIKKRLQNYSVFAYSESKDQSFVKVYFSVRYYLVHSKDVKYAIKEDEILKNYKDNWYFIRMKKEMDLG